MSYDLGKAASEKKLQIFHNWLSPALRAHKHFHRNLSFCTKGKTEQKKIAMDARSMIAHTELEDQSK